MSEQDQLQIELTEKNNLLNAAEQIAKFGHWQWNVVSNKITWSDNMYRIYGIEPGTELEYETYIDTIHPDDRHLVKEHLAEAFATKKFAEYYHRIILEPGTIKILHARGEVIVDEKGAVIRMTGTGQDVTEQKHAEQELLIKSRELEKMNIELQEFAYIASHDLQEPLRKMTVFTGMLEKDEASVISEKGKQYMEKIVKSSARMRSLIEDILQLSKLNAPIAFAPVDLNLVVAQVLSDMEINIAKSGAKTNVSPLPVIEANATQMGQLFQNLLSNAIKFRSGIPVIDITAELISDTLLESNGTPKAVPQPAEGEKIWCIQVKDNGVGIDEAYYERVFTIFQRLNGKQYEGTGIGLAVCKKIAVNHSGSISVKSSAGNGTTFTITLPAVQKNKTL